MYFDQMCKNERRIYMLLKKKKLYKEWNKIRINPNKHLESKHKEICE